MSKPDFNFDFMSKRRTAAIFSALLVVLSLASLVVNQLNWGLDFTGGTLVEVAFVEQVEPEQVRTHLEARGFEGFVAQYFGSDKDILIRMPPQSGLSDRENALLGDQVRDVLAEDWEGVELRRSEYVGPAVGEELTNQGGLGMLLALAMVMLYVAFRFQLKFAVGAVIALFHDVIITFGIFSITGWNFDLPVLAAFLAVIGYSLNDTIVVSDRIRENFRKIRRASNVDVINTSLNQTLGRTLVTSATTLMVLFALLFLGGELIRGFALGLIIGVVVGTYSSIYIAANVLLVLNIKKEDLAVPVREGADDPDMMAP